MYSNKDRTKNKTILIITPRRNKVFKRHSRPIYNIQQCCGGVKSTASHYRYTGFENSDIPKAVFHRFL